MNYSLNWSQVDQCTQFVYEAPSVWIPLVPLIIGVIASSWLMYDMYEKKASKLHKWLIFLSWLSIQLVFFMINYYFVL